jgi:hypothetical protein
VRVAPHPAQAIRQPHRISIHAKEQGGVILVKIQDDGKGIEAAPLRDRQSWGILGMHERAMHFGGFLLVGIPAVVLKEWGGQAQAGPRTLPAGYGLPTKRTGRDRSVKAVDANRGADTQGENGCIDHPTICRENKSNTTAKYNHPSWVRISGAIQYGEDPGVWTATGLHADKRWRQVGKECRHLLTLQRLLQHDLTVLVYSMNLKDIFCQIDSNGCSLHDERSRLRSG